MAACLDLNELLFVPVYALQSSNNPVVFVAVPVNQLQLQLEPLLIQVADSAL